MNARADTLCNTLTTPAVRDLAWACFSPPLILSADVAPADLDVANCGLVLDGPRQRWLESLDRQPGPLLNHLEKLQGTRLGLYFEALWHFFLQEDERVELVAHNLPVRDGTRTLGEFDCLYYCRERKRHFHLELAVKFYLGLPQVGAQGTYSHWNRWLGPGACDRLDLKMQRLLEHQLLLGQQAQAGPILHAVGIENLALEMEIKGRLFRPMNFQIAPPYGYNLDIPLSHWLTWREIDTQADYVVLDKRQWLAPVSPASRLVPSRLLPAHWPRLVAALDAGGHELERFFLVPEQWPEGS